MKDDGDPQNIRGMYNIHVLIKGPGELKPLRNELSGFVLKSIYAGFAKFELRLKKGHKS